MQAGVMVSGVAALLLLGFVLFGGPMILVDGLRRRRRMAIQRQVELTDALDGRFGAMVAPVVRKPLIGPWEIQIAVPFHRLDRMAGILSVVDEVFEVVDGASARPYRIFLHGEPDLLPDTRVPRSTGRWAGGPIATPLRSADS